ncbi:MAG: peptidyl-prolyl cis-trans isomerase SurA [Saprospiraceae bacterium]|jgi:peptidyl-prolyl cis-trans isomerase SurA
MKKILFLLLVINSSVNAGDVKGLDLPSELGSKWLLELEGDTVSAGEFWKVFNKNNFKQELPSKDALTEYFDLYQKFKLKVKEAEVKGLDTTSKFKTEILGYQQQLAKSYLTDKSVTEDLIKEAYDRSKWELRASHILINIKYHALPSDTLKAYSKAKAVLAMAETGVNFDSLAVVYSEDPSAKSNKGDLGYFSTFRMVYSFETGAFNTKVGGVSKLVRTRFGYHIIKVKERRETVGSIRVSHIMMVLNDKMTVEQKALKASKIQEVYEQLEGGAAFDMLARKYSEHYSSAEKGGVMPWFSSNQYDVKFENAAYDIKINGEYSKPIRTDYGWHIIKRLDRKERESFKKMELEIRKKVARSDRASKSKEAVLARIKSEYNFKEKSKRKYLNWFYENGDSTLISGTWKAPEKAKLKKKLFVFANKKYRQKDFYAYLLSKLRPRGGGDHRQLISFLYNSWVEELCFAHEEAMLPLKNKEYVSLLKEYRDGIILFDLTDQKVWSKAVEDTTGLKSFYEKHKSKWMWGQRVKGELYTCSEEKFAKEVEVLLNKGADMVEILEKVNKASQLNIRVENVFSDVAKKPALKGFKFTEGVSAIKKDNESYLILKTNEVFDPIAKDLLMVKGLVAADYQDQLMEDWLKELGEKYRLTYNKESVKELMKYVE